MMYSFGCRFAPLCLTVGVMGFILGSQDREAQAAVPCGEWACQNMHEYAPNKDDCYKHFVVMGGKNIARTWGVLHIWASSNPNNEDLPRVDQEAMIKRWVFEDPDLHCNNAPAVFPQRAICSGENPTTVDLAEWRCTTIDPQVRVVQPITPIPIDNPIDP